MKASRSVSRLMIMGFSGLVFFSLAACGGGDDGGGDNQTTAGAGRVIEGEVPEGGGPARLTFQGGDLLEALADFLGISAAQLRADLETPGATQAGVAALYGKSREELTQFLVQQNEKNLKQAVEEGSMSQETADELHAAFQQDIDSLLDSSGGAGEILIQPGSGPQPGSGEGPSFQTDP